MASRFVTFIPLVFLLASAVLLIFTVVNGASTSSPLDKLYWSQTDTSNIAGAPFDLSRWTFYTLCGVNNGNNVNCLPVDGIYPYSPYDNFPSGRSDLPRDFIVNRNTYYHLSRSAYALILISLAGSVISFVVTPLGFCFKACGGGFAGFFTLITFLFGAAGASCLTAAHVMGRKHFNDNGFPTQLGSAAFGILWAAVFCLLMSFIGCCMLCCGNKRLKEYMPAPQPTSNTAYYPNDVRASYNYDGATYVSPQDQHKG